MAKDYDEVVDTSYMLIDPDLRRFVEALTIQAERDNSELDEILAKKKKRFAKKEK